MREVCPKDFYWFSVVENDFPDLSPTAQTLLIIALLCDEDEAVLNLIPASSIGPLVKWMTKELIEERIMKVDKWLEMAFHLCKQRWDESIEWIEQQPMSKVLLMMRIQSQFNEKQEREMKKSSRKR
jgi:hypothetical protein